MTLFIADRYDELPEEPVPYKKYTGVLVSRDSAGSFVSHQFVYWSII